MPVELFLSWGNRVAHRFHRDFTASRAMEMYPGTAQWLLSPEDFQVAGYGVLCYINNHCYSRAVSCLGWWISKNSSMVADILSTWLVEVWQYSEGGDNISKGLSDCIFDSSVLWGLKKKKVWKVQTSTILWQVGKIHLLMKPVWYSRRFWQSLKRFRINQGKHL